MDGDTRGLRVVRVVVVPLFSSFIILLSQLQHSNSIILLYILLYSSITAVSCGGEGATVVT